MAGIHYGGNFLIVQKAALKQAELKLNYLLRTKKGTRKQKEDLRGTIRRAKQKIREYELAKDIPNIPDIIIKETIPNVPRDYEEGDQ